METIIFQGSISDYADQLEPMFEEHWKEVGMAGTTDLELQINWPQYTYLEAFGRLIGIGARKETGELMGYIAFIIYEHPHHRFNRFAMTDCFTVKKQYRSGMLITKMFKFAEKLLIGHNVTHIQFQFDCAHPLGRLAAALGYVPSNETWIKQL